MVDLQLETPLTESKDGACVLFEVMGFDLNNNCHKCRSAIKGVQFNFVGSLTTDAVVFVAVDVCISIESGQIQMTLGQSGRVYPRPTLVVQNALKVIETCAGIGCLGEGLSQMGFEVVLKHDKNHLLLHLAQQVNPGSTLQGDVCSNECIHAICQQVPFSCSVAAGVSCQPHSKLGDRRGASDPRAATLPMTLRMSFLTRQILIILECVEDVFKSEWAQQVLRTFCKLTGYRMSQGVLHLHHVWVSKRSRWWCILSHPTIGKIEWEPFPNFNPPPIVADVIDDFRICTREELKQLELDRYEMGKFGSVGIANNLIQWQSQSKTCLHSCGNQVTGCPCGCRQYPFQDERLQNGGIHGHLVQLKSVIDTFEGKMTACRHVHPVELALLNGLSPAKQFGQNLKLALCAIGQLASPIQSAWLGSFVLKHFQQNRWLTQEVIPPKLALLKVFEGLLKDRDLIFGGPSKPNTKNFHRILRAHLLGEQITSILPLPLETIEEGTSRSGSLGNAEEATREAGESCQGLASKQTKEPNNKGKGGKIPNQKVDENEWNCDYPKCPVCVPNQMIPKDDTDTIKDEIIRTEGEVSPTIPFIVEEGKNTPSDDQALIEATKIAENLVTEQHMQEFQKTGGVIGFNNLHHKKRKFAEYTQDIKTDGMRHELQEKKTHQQSEMQQSKTSDEEESQREIKIQIHDHRSTEPCEVKVEQGSMIADLIRAESDLSPEDGPKTAWTCLDTPVLPETQLSEGQFVSLQHYASFRQHRCPRNDADSVMSFSFPLQRIEALTQQGPFVALDEMEYYLQSLHFLERAQPIRPIDVIDDTQEDQTSYQTQVQQIVDWIVDNLPENNGMAKASAFLSKNHWNPIVFEVQQGTFRAVVTQDCPFVKEAVERVCEQKGFDLDLPLQVATTDFCS